MSYWDYKFYIIYLVFSKLNVEKTNRTVKMLNYKMETRMDVRHFSEVVVKADGTTKVQNKKRMHGEQSYAQSSERKKTGSVYRIVKSSTIYTASFKTQMFSTIPN